MAASVTQLTVGVARPSAGCRNARPCMPLLPVRQTRRSPAQRQCIKKKHNAIEYKRNVACTVSPLHPRCPLHYPRAACVCARRRAPVAPDRSPQRWSYATPHPKLSSLANHPTSVRAPHRLTPVIRGKHEHILSHATPPTSPQKGKACQPTNHRRRVTLVSCLS